MLATEDPIKTARAKLKVFDKAFADVREKLCPSDLSGENKTEWLRGFDDSRKYAFQNPQSEFYDRGFSAGVDFREDFFG